MKNSNEKRNEKRNIAHTTSVNHEIPYSPEILE